jgi:hypothetical protein
VPLNAFLLILWSGGLSYVRPFFPPRARKDRVPRGPRFWRNGRVGFSFLVCTISKNALGVAGRNLAKDAAEVSAADFADIVRSQALDKHLADNCGKKSSSKARP